MKDKDFKNLLKAIDEVRAIHKGVLKPARVFKFSPAEVKKIRTKLLRMTGRKIAKDLTKAPKTP